MAKVLEGLIAKGRRVRHPREQREVAFGLADLSTHEEMHDRIVKKGGIKSLLNILMSSNDIEAQRFAALCIANTSSTESIRMNIANHDSCLQHLINFMNNDDNDSVAKQYCAMSIGNIAACPKSHEAIMKLGTIDSLIQLMGI